MWVSLGKNKSFCQRFTCTPEQLPIKKLYTSVHENKKLYQCRVCDEEFSTSSGLKDHIVKIHKGRKIYQCPICSDKFIDKEKMNDHIVKIHKGRKIFQCPICSDKFIDEEKMNEHISTVHEGKKKSNEVDKCYVYPCNVCDEEFSTSSGLKDHSLMVYY